MARLSGLWRLLYCGCGGVNMEISVTVPASCGELVQGYTKGQPFLVTFPINRYAVATVRDDGAYARPDDWKSKAAMAKILAYYRCAHFPYSLYITSDIPRSKGMASSSADMGAVFYAVASVLGKSLSPQEAAYLAASIEPTDGVFCPEFCQLNYRTGQIWHIYEYVPFTVVMIDCGGTVDTIQFHQQEEKVYPIDREVLQALQKPLTYETIGRAATASALANQQILPKPRLPELIDAMMSIGAVGVNVAHSGTMIGVLFRPTTDIAGLTQTVRQKLQCLQYEGTYYDTVQTVRGGYSVTYN